MSEHEHHFGIGVMQDKDSCIVYVKCEHCDLMATASGTVTDFGGGYVEIGAASSGTEHKENR